MALSAERMKEWMGADLSGLDIMVVLIEGIHIGEHLVLVAALGIDSEGFKHPLGLMEGATEHSAVVQALIDDLIERGLDPAVPRHAPVRRALRQAWELDDAAKAERLVKPVSQRSMAAPFQDSDGGQPRSCRRRCLRPNLQMPSGKAPQSRRRREEMWWWRRWVIASGSPWVSLG